jgi:hypothetical protein
MHHGTTLIANAVREHAPLESRYSASGLQRRALRRTSAYMCYAAINEPMVSQPRRYAPPEIVP